MNDDPLDALDMRIIHALQCDARKTSAIQVQASGTKRTNVVRRLFERFIF